MCANGKNSPRAHGRLANLGQAFEEHDERGSLTNEWIEADQIPFLDRKIRTFGK